MNKTHILALAAALMAAPLAFAHSDGTTAGLPKTYCEESSAETGTHDYGSPATGFVVFLPLDASLPPCTYDPTWDGHYEFLVGGAYLLACEQSCVTYGPAVGDGVLACWGNYADHTSFPVVNVTDEALTPAGLPVAFTVAADHWNNVPPADPAAPECGDFESDYSADCVNECLVGFEPGLDGSYQVYVTGTVGHVRA